MAAKADGGLSTADGPQLSPLFAADASGNLTCGEEHPGTCLSDAAAVTFASKCHPGSAMPTPRVLFDGPCLPIVPSLATLFESRRVEYADVSGVDALPRLPCAELPQAAEPPARENAAEPQGSAPLPAAGRTAWARQLLDAPPAGRAAWARQLLGASHIAAPVMPLVALSVAPPMAPPMGPLTPPVAPPVASPPLERSIPLASAPDRAARLPDASVSLAEISTFVASFLATADLDRVSVRGIRRALASALGAETGLHYSKAWLSWQVDRVLAATVAADSAAAAAVAPADAAVTARDPVGTEAASPRTAPSVKHALSCDGASDRASPEQLRAALDELGYESGDGEGTLLEPTALAAAVQPVGGAAVGGAAVDGGHATEAVAAEAAAASVAEAAAAAAATAAAAAEAAEMEDDMTSSAETAAMATPVAGAEGGRDVRDVGIVREGGEGGEGDEGGEDGADAADEEVGCADQSTLLDEVSLLSPWPRVPACTSANEEVEAMPMTLVEPAAEAEAETEVVEAPEEAEPEVSEEAPEEAAELEDEATARGATWQAEEPQPRAVVAPEGRCGAVVAAGVAAAEAAAAEVAQRAAEEAAAVMAAEEMAAEARPEDVGPSVAEEDEPVRKRPRRSVRWAEPASLVTTWEYETASPELSTPRHASPYFSQLAGGPGRLDLVARSELAAPSSRCSRVLHRDALRHRHSHRSGADDEDDDEAEAHDDGAEMGAEGSAAGADDLRAAGGHSSLPSAALCAPAATGAASSASLGPASLLPGSLHAAERTCPRGVPRLWRRRAECLVAKPQPPSGGSGRLLATGSLFGSSPASRLGGHGCHGGAGLGGTTGAAASALGGGGARSHAAASRGKRHLDAAAAAAAATATAAANAAVRSPAAASTSPLGASPPQPTRLATAGTSPLRLSSPAPPAGWQYQGARSAHTQYATGSKRQAQRASDPQHRSRGAKLAAVGDGGSSIK